MTDILSEAGSLPSGVASSVDEKYRSTLLTDFGVCGLQPEACRTCRECLIVTGEVRAPSPGWRPMNYIGHRSGMGHVHKSEDHSQTLAGSDIRSGSEPTSTPEPSDRYKPADGYGPLPALSPVPSDIDEEKRKARDKAEREEAEEVYSIQLRAEREREIRNEVRRKEVEKEQLERKLRERLQWDSRYAPSSMRSTAPQQPAEGVWYSHAI